MHIFSAMSARCRVCSGEVHSKPSLTVPDQVVPLADMIRRYANGVPLVGNAADPEYYGDRTPPDPRDLDLNDLMDMRDELSESIEEFRRCQTKPVNPKPVDPKPVDAESVDAEPVDPKPLEQLDLPLE